MTVFAAFLLAASFTRTMERVSTMDPVHARSVYDAHAVGLVYETPLEVDYKARPYRLVPGFCELPEVSSGGLVYVFRRPESPIAAIELDLRAIDSNATYRVVGNSFTLVDGGDGFAMFKGAKIVVVPDARCVSDKTFAELAKFAKSGGIVIADGEKALMGDEWGKSVPSRQADARRFRRIADSGSRTRFNALADALDEIGARPPLALSCADGSRPYGVIWRTGRTSAGERVAFIASMSRKGVAVRLDGAWRELLNNRDVSGPFTIAPCEVLLLKGK